LCEQHGEILRRLELLLHQRSRIKWLKEGNNNTRFFHSIVNRRRRINGVKGLLKEGVWIDDLKGVKEEIKNFFHQKV